MRGILKATEFHQHCLWDAAFSPDRRKHVCHGFSLQVTLKRTVSGANVSPERRPSNAEPLNI